ncbi:MAG: bacterioferritin-associated ferredoxin [Chromatiales bacterium]
MLVCICHGVKDQDIERAIQNGVISVSQLSDKLHLGTSCGCCVDYAEEYLKGRQLGSSLQAGSLMAVDQATVQGPGRTRLRVVAMELDSRRELIQ